MSTGHDAHGVEAHADFDGEPVAELAADEPPTPTWVPVTGLVLVMGVALAGLAMQDAPAPLSLPPTPPAAATVMAAASAAPPRPVAARPSGDRPALSPEQAKDLQRRIEESRKRRAAASGAPAAPAPAPNPGQ